MDRIQKLFTNLAGRMTSENDLSDFVWALCQSNEGFKQFFLDFFFKNKLKAAEYAVDREVSCEGGRPDFVITRLGKCKDRYFVEVKKDDTNHHFKQYLEELRKDGHGIERLGYITMYALERKWLKKTDRIVAWDKNNCRWACQYRTWNDFLKALHDCIENAEDWAKGDDVRGLYAFVKGSCRVDELVSSFTLDKDRIGRVKVFAQALDGVVQGKSSIPIDGRDKVNLSRCDFIRDYEWSLGHIGRCFSATGNSCAIICKSINVKE